MANANLEMPRKYVMSILEEIPDTSGTRPQLDSNEPPPALSSKQLFYHSASRLSSLRRAVPCCQVTFAPARERRPGQRLANQSLCFKRCAVHGSGELATESDRAKTGCPSNSNDSECTTAEELTTSRLRQIKSGIDKCIFSSAHDIL